MAIRKAIARLVVAGSVLLVLASCLEDAPALFIVHNMNFDQATCEGISASTQSFRSNGFMDLTIARTYVMFPKVDNLMSPSGASSLGGGGVGGAFEGNRVTLSHALVGFTTPAGFDVPMPRNLEIPISGTLEPGSTLLGEIPVINEPLGVQLAASTQLDDRGEQVPIEVSVQYFGLTTSGTEVESNVFTFPMNLCMGCLLDFPLEAADPLAEPPNCRGILIDELYEVADIDCGCHPGQDEALDCRCCRLQAGANGATTAEQDQLCEPNPPTR
jgi:hypothetical protein